MCSRPVACQNQPWSASQRQPAGNDGTKPETSESAIRTAFVQDSFPNPAAAAMWRPLQPRIHRSALPISRAAMLGSRPINVIHSARADFASECGREMKEMWFIFKAFRPQSGAKYVAPVGFDPEPSLGSEQCSTRPPALPCACSLPFNGSGSNRMHEIYGSGP